MADEEGVSFNDSDAEFGVQSIADSIVDDFLDGKLDGKDVSRQVQALLTFRAVIREPVVALTDSNVNNQTRMEALKTRVRDAQRVYRESAVKHGPVLAALHAAYEEVLQALAHPST